MLQINETDNPVSGIRLAKYVTQSCDRRLYNQSEDKDREDWKDRMHVITAKKFFYCPVEKVATTFWRRVMYLLQLPSRGFKHPYQVPINSALSLKHEKHNPNNSYDDWFRFMFVRNPYERTLSAYIDKIFVPNPMFWERFGKPSISMFRNNATKKSLKCNHDTSFSEFVQFVVWAETKKEKQDSHFSSPSQLCRPCEFNFTFIGKMENAREDFPFVLRHFGLDSSVETMGANFQNLAADDAIVDSIMSPFSWRSKILTCMDWDEALMRIWRKLQIRGIIGMSQKYPLAPKKATTIRNIEFIKLAKEARLRSSSSELREQKKSILAQIYSTVPMTTLQKLQEVFKQDFKLFGYDDNPDFIFKRDTTLSKSFDNLDFRNS